MIKELGYRINKSHNSAKSIFVCSSRRSCKRISTCLECWQVYRHHLIGQIVTACLTLNFRRFYTWSFPAFQYGKKDGLLWISKEVRPKLYECLQRQKSAYISQVAIQPIGPDTVPHFHILGEAWIRTLAIRRCIARLEDKHGIELDTHTSYPKTVPDFENLAGYMLDKNLLPSLPFRPANVRLLTATQPTRLGWPSWHER